MYDEKAPKECQALVEEGWTYLDVRTPDEFLGGHPVGAVNVPFSMIGPGGLMPNPMFLGVVRDHHRGRGVSRMDYEAYEAMARLELARVAEDLLAAHPDVLGLALVHRFGRLEIGEASVGVAAAAAHRKPAFAACEWGIDTIKERVPIWKKEHYVEGDHHWVRADEMGEAATGGAPDAPPSPE